MKHVIGAAAGLFERCPVRDRAANEIDFVADAREILFLAGGEIVEHGDGMASAHQLVDGIRADKTRAPGDQITHQKVPPQLASRILSKLRSTALVPRPMFLVRNLRVRITRAL